MEQNNEAISLGGNILLKGFQGIERAKLVVLKKIIGNYASEIQKKRSDYEKLAVTLGGSENNQTASIELTAGGNSIAADDTQNNMFVAIGNAFKKLMEKI